MAYTLKQFCADHHALLTSGQPLAESAAADRRQAVDPAAQSGICRRELQRRYAIGKRTLHHDPDTDVYVLAHVYEGPKKGSPHSHGASWAVYGTARAVTEMTEWRRVNPESEEQAVLEPVAHYSLGPGDTRAYGPGVLHSTRHPEKAWVIRVTGTDLDAIPRFRFRPKTDKIIEKV